MKKCECNRILLRSDLSGAEIRVFLAIQELGRYDRRKISEMTGIAGPNISRAIVKIKSRAPRVLAGIKFDTTQDSYFLNNPVIPIEPCISPSIKFDTPQDSNKQNKPLAGIKFDTAEYSDKIESVAGQGVLASIKFDTPEYSDGRENWNFGGENNPFWGALLNKKIYINKYIYNIKTKDSYEEIYARGNPEPQKQEEIFPVPEDKKTATVAEETDTTPTRTTPKKAIDAAMQAATPSDMPNICLLGNKARQRKKASVLQGWKLWYFARLVTYYGNFNGLTDAVNAFDEHATDEETAAAMVEAARATKLQRERQKAQGLTVKYLQGWISGQRWLDAEFAGSGSQQFGPQAKITGGNFVNDIRF